MPQRTRSHVLETLSRNRLHEAFAREWWTVEDLAKDYGEDLLVRIFENGQATPYSFFVQVKATEDVERFRRKGSPDIKVPIEVGHISHWTRFIEPVFLIVWDAKTGAASWVCVQDALEGRDLKVKRTSARPTIQIVVPNENQLNSDGLKRIRGISKLRFRLAIRHGTAADVLKEALNQFGVSVEAYEPDGGLVQLKYPNGDKVLHLFGDLLKRLKSMSVSMNLPFEETLSECLRVAATELERSSVDHDMIARELREDTARREREAADELD
jgi:hypothetical protein